MVGSACPSLLADGVAGFNHAGAIRSDGEGSADRKPRMPRLSWWNFGMQLRPSRGDPGFGGRRVGDPAGSMRLSGSGIPWSHGFRCGGQQEAVLHRHQQSRSRRLGDAAWWRSCGGKAQRGGVYADWAANTEERLKESRDVFSTHPDVKIVDVVDIAGDTNAAFDKTQVFMAQTGAKKIDAFVCLESASERSCRMR